MVLLCVLFMAPTHAAGIYKWVDAEGNVHYGEQPPSEGAKEMRIHSSGGANQDDKSASLKKNIDPKTQRDKMIQALQGDRLARQEKKQKQQQKKNKIKQQCAQVKDTLRRYRHSAGLYKLDADGNRISLPDSVKQAETKRMQAEIKKWCK